MYGSQIIAEFRERQAAVNLPVFDALNVVITGFHSIYGHNSVPVHRSTKIFHVTIDYPVRVSIRAQRLLEFCIH